MITTFLIVTSSMLTCSTNWLSICSNLSMHKQNRVSILTCNTNGAGEKNLKFHLPYTHGISCSHRFENIASVYLWYLEFLHLSAKMLMGHPIKSLSLWNGQYSPSITFQMAFFHCRWKSDYVMDAAMVFLLTSLSISPLTAHTLNTASIIQQIASP